MGTGIGPGIEPKVPQPGWRKPGGGFACNPWCASWFPAGAPPDAANTAACTLSIVPSIDAAIALFPA